MWKSTVSGLFHSHIVFVRSIFGLNKCVLGDVQHIWYTIYISATQMIIILTSLSYPFLQLGMTVAIKFNLMPIAHAHNRVSCCCGSISPKRLNDITLESK